MNTIKKKIVVAAKRMQKLGLNIGSEGNLSYRDKDIVYITPSGLEPTKLNEKKISEVCISGKIKNGIKPSSEMFMHLFIYKNCKEINSVVHCHSTWSSILSCQRIKIPSFHYMVAEFGGEDIKCSKYATFGTKKLASNVLDAIKGRQGCLIANHGQITIGKSIDNTVNLANALEKLSKQYYFCLLSKRTSLLNLREMKKVIKLFKDYKIKH